MVVNKPRENRGVFVFGAFLVYWLTHVNQTSMNRALLAAAMLTLFSAQAIAQVTEVRTEEASHIDHPRYRLGDQNSQTLRDLLVVSSIPGVGKPLIVIDGVVLSGEVREESHDPLDTKVTDIVKIEVIKDAPTLALYAPMGNRGVNLITTKSGKETSK